MIKILDDLVERWKKQHAHTYASENADRYRGFNDGCHICALELRAAIPVVEAERKELMEALIQYFREIDSPVQDTGMIHMRRNQLRAALARVKGA